MWDTNQQQTRTAFGFLVQLLAERDALRPGLGVDQATDIAFVIADVETCLQFSDVCGWTLDEWQQRTSELLVAALVGSAALRRRPRGIRPPSSGPARQDRS